MIVTWLARAGLSLALCFGGLAHAQVAIVLNSGDGTISLVDMAARKETSRIPVGKEPHHLMVTPDDKDLIVANAASNNLVFLDPDTGKVIKRIEKKIGRAHV